MKRRSRPRHPRPSFALVRRRLLRRLLLGESDRPPGCDTGQIRAALRRRWNRGPRCQRKRESDRFTRRPCAHSEVVRGTTGMPRQEAGRTLAAWSPGSRRHGITGFRAPQVVSRLHLIDDTLPFESRGQKRFARAYPRSVISTGTRIRADSSACRSTSCLSCSIASATPNGSWVSSGAQRRVLRMAR